jgi:uncharacterized protein involved in exopolysaccharide biosynthesis
MSSIDTEIHPKTFISMDGSEDDVEPGKPLYEHVRNLFMLTGVLWLERRRLFWRTISLVLLTFGLLFLLPNRYTATAVLNPPSSEPMSGMNMLIGAKTGISDMASSALGGMMGMQDQGQLYIKEMMSNSVQDRLIERFDLKKVYRDKLEEDARKDLTAATMLDEDTKSGAISVSVTDKSPTRAAELANAYAAELGLLNARVNADSAKAEREYFGYQLQQARELLQKDTKELAAFGIQNGTVDANEQGTALAGAAAALEGQILGTEAEIKGLLQIYTPQHENVLALQAKLAAMRQQLQELKGKAPANLDNGTDNLKETLNVSPAFMDLGRKVKIQESVVETLSQQFELSKLEELYKVSSVQVFDPALVPERKSKPHRALISVLLGVVFFFLQCTFIIARNHWRSLSTDDPWRVTLLPAVAVMSCAYARVSKSIAAGDRNFVTRWRKRRLEKRASAKVD